MDLESQEAYELAVRGLLRPFGEDLPPLILNIRCIHFEPPDFELGEYQCCLLKSVCFQFHVDISSLSRVGSEKNRWLGLNNAISVL